MQTERTVPIAAEAEEIWVLLTEFEQMQRWMPEMVSEAPITSGPPGVGEKTRVGVKEGSRVVEYQSEVMVFDATTHLEIELTRGSLGESPMRVGYRMTPSSSGVTLVYSVDWKPVGCMMIAMTPLIRIIGNRNATKSMARLKAVADSGSGNDVDD